MPGHKPTLLILGGTGEAAALAQAIVAAFGNKLRVISSLAGRTSKPGELDGEVRVGGFGGTQGLAHYLRDIAADYLIDASHPFATEISKHACLATATTATPCLVLLRPPWCAEPGDNWHEVDDMVSAAKKIPSLGQRVFLSVGTRSLKYFSELRSTWFLVRLIDPPGEALPLAQSELILGRGPFDSVGEQKLLEQHSIDLLVTRASGGAAIKGKIDAARQLGLPVIMLRRPAPPPGESVETIDAALEWLRHKAPE